MLRISSPDVVRLLANEVTAIVQSPLKRIEARLSAARRLRDRTGSAALSAARQSVDSRCDRVPQEHHGLRPADSRSDVDFGRPVEGGGNVLCLLHQTRNTSYFLLFDFDTTTAAAPIAPRIPRAAAPHATAWLVEGLLSVFLRSFREVSSSVLEVE